MPDRSRMHQESSVRKRSHGRFVGPDTDRRAQSPGRTVVIAESNRSGDLVVIDDERRIAKPLEAVSGAENLLGFPGVAIVVAAAK